MTEQPLLGRFRKVESHGSGYCQRALVADWKVQTWPWVSDKRQSVGVLVVVVVAEEAVGQGRARTLWASLWGIERAQQRVLKIQSHAKASTPVLCQC